MRILIIKTSSLGDVIHTLPALTDASRAFPSARFDWVIEEGFKEIPSWHPCVDRIIPVAIRRWRNKLFQKKTWEEWRLFYRILREEKYDYVIDAQGLLKSAWIAWSAKGPSAGFDFRSARGGLAGLFYRRSYAVTPAHQQHAIARLRYLFSQVLEYAEPHSVPDYGLDRERIGLMRQEQQNKNYLVFLHGTTWPSKRWPERYWIELGNYAHAAGFQVQLPAGSAEEQRIATEIAGHIPEAIVLPPMNLENIASVLMNAKGVVSVDTGLGHLAAALAIPTVSIYGPTNPLLTGTMGASQKHMTANFPCAPCLSRHCRLYQNDHSPLYPLKPPCFTTVPPERVWTELLTLLG